MLADSTTASTLHAALAVCSRKAMAGFPSVLRRFNRGLPSDQSLFVVTRLEDDRHRREQVFVSVDSVRRSRVFGKIRSLIVSVSGYRLGQAVALDTRDLIDWMISKPDGSEEGNLLGKFIETAQAEKRLPHELCTSATAPSPSEGRASVAVGIEGGGGWIAQGRYLQGGYRIARAGPLALELSASRSDAHQWHRYARVTTMEYCPGCPPPDTANAFVDWRAGVEVRFDRMPRFLSRLVPFVGVGTYHAPWLGLPARDAHRPPVWTGYRLGGLGLRVTRKPQLSVALTLTQLRNVRHRDDRTDPRLSIRWDAR